ncbi:hypothetical protein AZH53_09850 [Methanomicrobiaceae archaeon CYW5]|uniref:hypothetical protein n=1 Tax=Methanovulcanius yangii TaxID=1789227 RepID=UPI0029C9D221|nr:hypothetical protein [Methanovulcanius yangii]MBT8508707.1 hypothetical protein [Methanovulcanius yangii]
MTRTHGDPVGRITSTPEGELAMVIDGREYVMTAGEVDRLMEGEGLGTFLAVVPAGRQGWATRCIPGGHAKQNLFGGGVTFYTHTCICNLPRERLADVIAGERPAATLHLIIGGRHVR